MSAEQFVPVLRRFLDAFNQRDLALLDQLSDELVTADMIWHDPSMPSIPEGTGPAVQKAFNRQALESNPDMHITVHETLVAENWITTRASLVMNNPTTRAPEPYCMIEVDRIVDNRIAESWSLSVPGKW